MSNNIVHVTLVDDDWATVETLEMLLDGKDDISIESTHDCGESLLEHLEYLEKENRELPDIALMDIEMPGMDGITVARRVYEHYPSVRVVMFTAFRREATLLAALKAEVAGFITKGAGGKEIRFALHHVYDGNRYMSETPTEILTRSYQVDRVEHVDDPAFRAAVESMTYSQRKVLKLLARGLTNRRIASDLRLSEYTVKDVVSEIMIKLGVDNRTQVAVITTRNQYY